MQGRIPVQTVAILTQSLVKIVAVPIIVQTVPVLSPQYPTTSILVNYATTYFRSLTTTYANRSVRVFGSPGYRSTSIPLIGSQVIPTL